MKKNILLIWILIIGGNLFVMAQKNEDISGSNEVFSFPKKITYKKSKIIRRTNPKEIPNRNLTSLSAEKDISEKVIGLNIFDAKDNKVKIEDPITNGTRFRFELSCPPNYYVSIFSTELDEDNQILPGTGQLIFPTAPVTNAAGSRMLRCGSSGKLTVPNEKSAIQYFELSETSNAKAADEIYVIFSKKRVLRTQESIAGLKAADIWSFLEPYTNSFELFEKFETAEKSENDNDFLVFTSEESKSLFANMPPSYLFKLNLTENGGMINFKIISRRSKR